jgi:hypothetical protein
MLHMSSYVILCYMSRLLAISQDDNGWNVFELRHYCLLTSICKVKSTYLGFRKCERFSAVNHYANANTNIHVLVSLHRLAKHNQIYRSILLLSSFCMTSVQACCL